MKLGQRDPHGFELICGESGKGVLIMDRSVLDRMYKAGPANAFRKALAGTMDRVCFDFLREHAAELSVAMLSQLFEKLADDDYAEAAPFIAAFADRLAEDAMSNGHEATHALVLAERIDEHAWADLSRRLKGRIPDHVWYFYVDRVKGGEIFSALNVRPPGVSAHDTMHPDAERRVEPLVVQLLDEPTNDLKARAYVMTLRLDVILAMHARLPRHFPLDEVKRAAATRVTLKDERWSPPLPDWMAPYVVERLEHCEDDEAVALYAWLSQQDATSQPGDLFQIALKRMKRNALSRSWHPIVGSYLTTGKAWKRQGREVIEFFAAENKGFPRSLINASLNAIHASDGTTIEARRDAILRTIHDEGASVLVARAEDAIKRGDWKTARQALEGVQCLDPGSFIRKRLHFIRKIPDLPADIADHIAACEELARVGGKKPTDVDFHNAFIASYGGFS